MARRQTTAVLLLAILCGAYMVEARDAFMTVRRLNGTPLSELAAKTAGRVSIRSLLRIRPAPWQNGTKSRSSTCPGPAAHMRKPQGPTRPYGVAQRMLESTPKLYVSYTRV